MRPRHTPAMDGGSVFFAGAKKDPFILNIKGRFVNRAYYLFFAVVVWRARLIAGHSGRNE